VVLSHRALLRTAVVVGLAAACVAEPRPVLGQAASARRAPSQPAPLAPPGQTDRPRVRLVATGGTIANRSGSRLSPAELLRLAPQHERFVTVEAEAFSNVPSGALTLDQWLALSRRLGAILREDGDCAGVVVTSGTDTLEELAYFLHLTVRSDKPVVVVGAMRPPDAPGYDGAANLVAALRVAAAPEARGRGTLVVLHDEIHAAREVVKTDPQQLPAFASRDGGRLGTIDADAVTFVHRHARRGGAQSEFDLDGTTALPRVDVLLTYQGATGDLIRAAIDAGAAGIVLASAAGGTSGTQMDGVRYALSRRAAVVTATRTPAGRIASAGEAGRVFAVPGTIAADDLAPIKARVLLMLALTRTTDAGDIQRMFREY
jgi:L-asparaginase